MIFYHLFIFGRDNKIHCNMTIIVFTTIEQSDFEMHTCVLNIIPLAMIFLNHQLAERKIFWRDQRVFVPQENSFV